MEYKHGRLFSSTLNMLSVTRSDTEKTNCLIIDSCGFDTTTLIDMLAQNHCDFEKCSFDQASAKLVQCDFQLIFLHSCFTDTNALSELHFLRQQYPLIPVIMFDHQLTTERIDEFMFWRASDCVITSKLTNEVFKRVIRYNLMVNQYNTELTRLNQLDPLTGMTNRQQFYKQLSQKLKLIGKGEASSQLALISVDLDGFRRFNNINGYSAGDIIVKEMSKRLAALIPGQLSRLGNDEFVLLQETPADDNLTSQTIELCNNILHSLTEPYIYHELEVILPCSIGVALVPEHSCEIDTLVHQATQARIKAKETSSCSYVIFDQEQHRSDESQTNLEPELISAIRRNEFELFYQPRINISSGKIIGAEGLIRWRHPEKGLIYPDTFIPTAERTGMIVPIGYWVIQQAGDDMQRLKACGLEIDRLSINLSFRQFQDSYLCQTIQRLIKKHSIDTSILEFELTESALFNNELHVREGIEGLHKLGINFSLDDFGTGYSSFSLLQTLPISSLKIDRSFVSGVNQNPDDAEIVKAIIRLAHSLNKEVIAEGVETSQQLNFLDRLGCHQAQGYLYSKPVSYDDFKTLLESGQRVTAESAANQ